MSVEPNCCERGRFGDVVSAMTFLVAVAILGLMLWRRSQSCATPVEPLEQAVAYQSQLLRDKTDAILAKLDSTDQGSQALQSDQIWRGRVESINLRLEAIEKVLRSRRPLGQTSQAPDNE